MPTKKSDDNSIEKGLGLEQISIEADTITVGVLGPDGEVYDNENEVFRKTEEGIDYRTVGGKRAMFVIFKVIFSLGILSLPSTMLSLGALGGSLSIVGWNLLNTYCAILVGNFRRNHTTCHSIADMAMILGGTVLKEVTGVIFLLGWIIAVGAGILGVATGLNALSNHAICMVWWSFVTSIVVACGASLPKFHSLGWFTWIGSASIFSAVFILVIAVTQHDRPAAAPQSGPFELGYFVIAHPSFFTGMVASLNIFNSSAGANSFIPLMVEMKRPQDFNKVLSIVMVFAGACYLSFSLVIYRWCGQWVVSPSLASAGPLIEKICYGIALPGLLAIALLCLHVASKYLFVRILRNSPHLQANSAVHWITWFSCTFGLGTISFIMAEAIPVFNDLLALNASFCFAPLAIMLPGGFWLYDHKSYRYGTRNQRVAYWFHWLLPVIGAFFFVGGTYATIESIIISNQIGGLDEFRK